MSRPTWTSPRKTKGLSLVEALVTLALGSLAFSLIFAMSRAQSRVYRHQQVMERFLVDAEAAMKALENDLSSAFLVQPTSGGIILEIAHLIRDGRSRTGVAPFNGSPADEVLSTVPPPPADFRGVPLRTTYSLIGQRLVRQSANLLDPTVNVSDLILLEGINSAIGTVTHAAVAIKLTLVSDGRAHTVERRYWAGGLAQR